MLRVMSRLLGKTYAGMVFEVLSWFDVLFQTGIVFPAGTIMRNDQ